MSDIWKEVHQLIEYAEYDNTEYGEYCLKLCSLYDRRDQMPDDFEKMLVSAILQSLMYYKENCRLVERVEQTTTKYTELEWAEI